jgi:hypothetical protein
MFAQQLNSGSALYGKSNLLSEFRKSIDQLNFLRSQKKTDTSSSRYCSRYSVVGTVVDTQQQQSSSGGAVAAAAAMRPGTLV